jgi:hypothetical protein
MSVHDLAARRAAQMNPDAPEVVVPLPPSLLAPVALPMTGTARGHAAALGWIRAFDIPEDAVSMVSSRGQCVTFDLTPCLHPAREMRYLSGALGLVLDERQVETPEGYAAVELRCQRYEDAILLTCFAVIPVPATWGSA